MNLNRGFWPWKNPLPSPLQGRRLLKTEQDVARIRPEGKLPLHLLSVDELYILQRLKQGDFSAADMDIARCKILPKLDLDC